jgi:hypothetical protein
VEIFGKRTALEKRMLLKFALTNCTWKERKLSVTYWQPFYIIAKNNIPPSGSGPGGNMIPVERSEWWARQDSIP